MDLTGARVSAYLLLLHPAFGLIGPLASAPHVPGIPAGRDRVAPDIARRAQIQPPREGLGGSLVGKSHPLLPASGHDLRHALEAQSERKGVQVGVTASGLDHPVGLLETFGDTTGHERRHHAKHAEPCMHAGLRLGREELLGRASHAPPTGADCWRKAR